MLTSDLVRVGKKEGRLTPRYLKAKDRERLAPVAEALVATYQSMVGATLAELEEAAGAIPFAARDRPIVAGLRKLCDDRTELEQQSPLDPEVVREAVFLESAKGHRSDEGFRREEVAARAAETLGVDVATLERALFADLRDAQVVSAFTPLAPAELFDRYDVGLAQALLLRASRVTLTFSDARPSVVRDLFRSARFHGLLTAIERQEGKSAWKLTVDGPYSLFESVQKYGLRLAMFLPSALALQSFELTAEVLWGPERAACVVGISHADGLTPPRGPRVFERPEIAALKTAFEALGSAWELTDNDRVLVAKDRSAVVPDLVASNKSTGEEVFIELFGFWSRAAVWRRVEQIQAGMPARLILAVSKGARVSEEVLDEEEAGSSVYVFKSALSAKEILARLDAAKSTKRTKYVLPDATKPIG